MYRRHRSSLSISRNLIPLAVYGWTWSSSEVGSNYYIIKSVLISFKKIKNINYLQDFIKDLKRKISNFYKIVYYRNNLINIILINYLKNKYKKKLFIKANMESTIQFIEVIKKHEAIYDTRNKDYKNMERKSNAWMSVSNEIGLSVEACKRKWKNLRDSYTKYLRSYRTGTKTSKKYQYWAHADHMDFLRPFQGPGRSQNVVRLEDIYTEFNSIKNDTAYDLSYEVLEKSSTENLQNLNVHNSNNQNHHHHDHDQNDDISIPQNNVQSSSSPSSAVAEVMPLAAAAATKTIAQTAAAGNDDRNIIKIKQIELDATSMFFLSLAKSVRAMPKKYQANVKMRCMKIVNDIEIELENSMFDVDHNNLSNLNNRPLKHKKYNGQVQHGQQQQSLPQQQSDNSEHFLYVMSPSRVEAMIDISSDEEHLDINN